MRTGTRTNQQFRLAARPVGMIKRSDWNLTVEPVGDLADGEIEVKTLYVSLDPAMRGWLNEANFSGYARPVKIGEVMRAVGVGQVVASRSPRFAAGDFVSGFVGVQQYWIGDAQQRASAFHRIDPDAAPLVKYLNALGFPGMTAYFGLMDIGQPKPGETVVISAAAGAVGQTAGQLAKLKGCRVIGIAGGQAKCDFVVDELGFDACIDYKSDAVKAALERLCPQGIDVYFDNVGGEILDAVLTRTNNKARIVVCGAVSQYNNTTRVHGPANYLSLLFKRGRMEGFIVFDYLDRFPEALAEISGQMKAGTLKTLEHVVEGIESFPQALQMLYEGKNFGKLVLQVAQP